MLPRVVPDACGDHSGAWRTSVLLCRLSRVPGRARILRVRAGRAAHQFDHGDRPDGVDDRRRGRRGDRRRADSRGGVSFVGVALIGAGVGALLVNLIWASLGREPHIVIVILFAIAGALAALALQRYVIIVATGFGGAWTTIVGALALMGDKLAVEAAARNNVWLAYPMNPAPGQRWVIVAWLVLGLVGVIVQLSVTAKGKK